MKKYILLVLCVLCIFALVACDKDVATDTGSSEKDETASILDEIKSEYGGAFDGNNTTEEIVPDFD